MKLMTNKEDKYFNLFISEILLWIYSGSHLTQAF